MAVEIVLQTADEHGNLSECWSYLDLPLDQSCRVTVVSGSQRLRDQLLACLRVALRAQGGIEGGCAGNPGGGSISLCRAHAVSGVQQLTVVVVDGAHPGTPALEATVRTFLSQAGARAIGLLPVSESTALLPPSLDPFQASRFVSDVCEAVEDVLSAAGADLEDRKIFLSYSRHDATEALELAEALADQRFSVYLDTRSNPPGSIWDDVLRDALVDAGLVIVLETAASYGSRWVRKEIGLALARGAGVIAVQPLRGAYSFRAPAARFLGPPRNAGPFVAQQHRLRLSTQRAIRISSVLAALAANGVAAVAAGPNIQAGNFLIGVHERPVDVPQLRRTCNAAQAAGLAIATYSPLPVLGSRCTDRRWMHVQAGAAAYADGTLTALAQRVATP
jgi:TIR domain